MLVNPGAAAAPAVPVPTACRGVRWRPRRGPSRAVALIAATVLLGGCATQPAPPATAAATATGSPATTTSAVPSPRAQASASPAAPSPPEPASPSPGASPSPAYGGPWPVPSWCPAGAAGSALHDDVRLPILYYHRVEQPPPDFATWSTARKHTFIDYDTLPAAFAAQLDWLAAHGYTTIRTADLAAHWEHGCVLPAHPAILTFDDGTPDWVATILPQLRARGMVAEFYLTLDAIAEHHISWAEVAVLAENGMGIGGHDVHHVQLAALGNSRPPASAATMWFEVDQARRRIGAHIGTQPDSMAYVGGGFDATLVSQVERAGYATARSIRHGILQRWSDRFVLRVVRVGVYDDVLQRATWTVDPAVPLFAAKVLGEAD